jgi:hypothetical protein
MLTLQYLEYSPLLSQLDENKTVERIRLAYDRLPFTHLLIGWQVPPRLLERCRLEAEQLGIRFLRWHPLLTGDGVFQPQPCWQVPGVTGEVVRGFEDKPEFTFVCPNHPAVQEAQSLRIEHLIKLGVYQGFFLDRVRYPSPSANPLRDLGCFCQHCRQKAAASNLDLERVEAVVLQRAADEKGRISLVQALLGGRDGLAEDGIDECLQPLLEFRQQSVSDFVALVTGKLRAADLEIGLDSFSPGLTSMVGQDLASLSVHVDWIKIMSYAHTFGPAGLPFELSQLVNYLVTTTRLNPAEALGEISAFLSLPLPSTLEALHQDGLSPAALAIEVRRGVESCKVPLLAGMELMDLEGVSQSRLPQIIADLEALRGTGAAGLAISWDLLHIPLDWLSLVNAVYRTG